jgi:SSS family transporter
LSTADIVILVLYFVVSAAIGIAAARMVHNREDFLMGGRKFGKTLMVFFTFGAGTHADSAVGVAAQSYKYGLAGIWYQWVMLLTLPIYWLLAPVFRRARVQTTADFFERRFGTEFMYFYAFFAMFISVAYTSVMLYGSARLIESLTDHAISWQWAILLTAVVSFLYGTLGGLIAAVWNDLFQGILTIVMSIMLLPFFWSHIGGLEGFQAALPNAAENLKLVLDKDMTVFWIIMMSINSLVSMVAQPHIMANAGAAKTELDSRVGFVGGVLLKRIMTIPWALTGVMAIALFGANTIEPDHAFGAMSRELLPNGFVGLMLACVMASVMDNCAIMMVTFAGIYTNSIHTRLVSTPESEKRLVAVTRNAGLCFAVVCIALAYAFDDITEAMRFLWKAVPPMGIPFLLGICWRKTNRYGAFASVLTALTAVLVAEYVFRWEGDAGLPYTILLFLSVGTFFGIFVSLITPSEPAAKLDAFELMLKTPIGQEDVLRNAGLVQIPGTETFELPESASERESASPVVQKTSFPVTRRQSIFGFAAVSVIVVVMLGSMNALASWLANG